MTTEADAGAPQFTLDPTDHPLWLRLEFYEPMAHVHTLIVESQWVEKFTAPGVSLYNLAATAIEMTLAYEPDFNFPPTFSLGRLMRLFPHLKNDLSERLKG